MSPGLRDEKLDNPISPKSVDVELAASASTRAPLLEENTDEKIKDVKEVKEHVEHKLMDDQLSDVAEINIPKAGQKYPLGLARQGRVLICFDRD